MGFVVVCFSQIFSKKSGIHLARRSPTWIQKEDLGVVVPLALRTAQTLLVNAFKYLMPRGNVTMNGIGQIVINYCCQLTAAENLTFWGIDVRLHVGVRETQVARKELPIHNVT